MMRPQRRSVHAGGAAWQAGPAAFTLPRFFISYMCEFALFTWLILTPWYYLFYDLPPQFSVQLAPVGRGLDVAAAPAPAPAFHVALHASNRRATERCYRHGEGVVSYAGFTIASGRVPGFCVPGKGNREVPFQLAREDGVGLPEHQRDHMAAALKVGAMELEVQVRFLQLQGGGDSTSGRSTRMWCKTRVGAAQPPELTVCTALALQNWFDIDNDAD